MRDDEDNDPDPLAEWRQTAAIRAAGAAPKENYTAFDNPVDREPTRIHFCPVGEDAWEWMPYAGLERIVHDGLNGTIVALIWSFAVVVIRGRNLQKLDRHFAHEGLREVRAFDPARFHKPIDLTAPFIDRIEIHTQSREALAKAETELIADVKRRH